MIKNPFQSLNTLFTTEKPLEKRRLRHTFESEIINIALDNLSQSPMGIELIEFINEKEINIAILRGRTNRAYSITEKFVHISVADNAYIDDPEITIHLAGAMREAAQEYDTMLRRVGVDHGESIYVHREGQKFEDKLFWQTGIVYELGILANREEFIDSFTLMGYRSLIDAYQDDLEQSKQGQSNE